QHGPDHPALVPLLVRRAQLWREQAQYEQAAALLQRALRLSTRLRVPGQLPTVETLRELTILAWRRGEYAEAVRWGQQAMTLLEPQEGADAAELLTLRHYLALAVRDQGRSAEAGLLFQQALADCERLLGPTHPQTLKTLDG